MYDKAAGTRFEHRVKDNLMFKSEYGNSHGESDTHQGCDFTWLKQPYDVKLEKRNPKELVELGVVKGCLGIIHIFVRVRNYYGKFTLPVIVIWYETKTWLKSEKDFTLAADEITVGLLDHAWDLFCVWQDEQD